MELSASTVAKTVESGIIPTFRSASFVLCFESEPFWLFALHSTFIDKVYVTNAIKSFSELHKYLSLYEHRRNLYNATISRLGFNKFVFSFSPESIPDQAIILISGSPSFFADNITPYSRHRVAFISDEHFSKRKIPHIRLPLRRLSHAECGGATAYISLMGYHNVSATPHTSSVRRSIKHFLDFSIRPNIVDSSHPVTYAPVHRLCVRNITRPVVYSTGFISSGVGQRSLTSNEVGLMFGLSDLQAKSTVLSSFPFPPVQCLTAILEPLLELDNPAVPPPRFHIPDAPMPTHTYFQSLNKHLPLSWSHVIYKVDVSAKSDDAEPVFRHWNERITLLFPQAQSLLSPLHRLILTRIFRDLYLEYTGYLRHIYGPYQVLLEEAQRLNGGDNYDTSFLHDLLTIQRFQCDWRAGTHVLSTYLNSSYFGWDRGSALIYWR